MKKFIFILSCAYVLLAIMGCTDRSADAVQRRLDDTLYTEENILMTYDLQPERALGMIDTAVIVGTLSDFRADLLRAKVYCSGIEAANYDSAIVIGERLMQHDSIMAHQNLQEEVLDILMSASRLCHDDDQALYWGMKLSELYRQRDETTEALRTDAELGKLAVQLGQQREGLALIDSVVRQLEGQRHFNELDATIIALKRKAEVCYEKGLRADMIPAARRMLELLSDYEQPRGIFVDTMNKSNMNIVGIVIGIFQMPSDGIDKCTTPIPMPWMHHQTSRFIHNNHSIIFIDHIKWDVLRNDFVLITRTIQHQSNDIKRLYLIAALNRFPIGHDIASICRFLNTVTRRIGNLVKEVLVHPNHLLPLVHHHTKVLV